MADKLGNPGNNLKERERVRRGRGERGEEREEKREEKREGETWIIPAMAKAFSLVE